MADPNKYKSLSVPREDWEQLGVLASKLTDQIKDDWKINQIFYGQQRCEVKWEK